MIDLKKEIEDIINPLKQRKQNNQMRV